MQIDVLDVREGEFNGHQYTHVDIKVSHSPTKWEIFRGLQLKEGQHGQYLKFKVVVKDENGVKEYLPIYERADIKGLLNEAYKAYSAYQSGDVEDVSEEEIPF